MVNIAFCNPPVSYYCRRKFDVLPVISLAILTRLFNNAGHKAVAVDLEMIPEWEDELDDLLEMDVIGFTSLDISVIGISDCIKHLRKSGYNGKIVLGGIYATVNPEQALSLGADLVVTGECEGNVVELVESATGIQQGETMDIDEIPLPDWDSYKPDITNYRGQYKILNPKASVSMWTRGCPFKCIYCANLIFNGQKTRYRKPELIAQEMRDLKDRGIDRVYVYDDELIGTAQPEGWMKEIADLMEPLDMIWITQGRCSAKHITLELLKDMYRAGCRMILWGAESFSQSVLDNMRKRTNVEDIIHSLRLSKQAGLINSLYTMIGNYKETPADVTITERKLREIYSLGLVDYCQTFVCNIMPGTELERIAKQGGWYHKPKFGMASMKSVNYPTPWLTVADMKAGIKRYKHACPVGSP